MAKMSNFWRAILSFFCPSELPKIKTDEQNRLEDYKAIRSDWSFIPSTPGQIEMDKIVDKRLKEIENENRQNK